MDSKRFQFLFTLSNFYVVYVLCRILFLGDLMRIDGSFGIFDINLVGTLTNNTYLGTFKVKCLLSPIEQIKADKLYRDLLGNNAHLTSNHVASLAYAASQLHMRIVDAPPFWDGADLGGTHIEDENVILEVIEKAIEAQAIFVEEKREELKKRQKILANMIKGDVIEREEEEGSEPIKSTEEMLGMEEDIGIPSND